MKLERLMSGAFAVAAVALACGCSTTVAPTAKAPLSAEAASISGTTNLMSAQMLGPAPRVGKAHLAVDDLAFDANDSVTDESAPKEARRDDGSHRGGGFGTSK